jgi:hypothetical protein
MVLIMLLAACGGGDLVETASADLNLSAADLGGGYSLSDEQGYDEVTAGMDAAEADDATDASLRMFSTPDGMGIVMGIVINFTSVSTAKTNMRDVLDGFEEGLTEGISGVTVEELDAPNLGEDAVLSKATITDDSLGGMTFNVYLVGFRHLNVISVAAVFGLEDFATEDLVMELGEKLEAKLK